MPFYVPFLKDNKDKTALDYALDSKESEKDDETKNKNS